MRRMAPGPSNPTLVWIVSSDHWPRAYLRAELIERGYDAVGFVTLREALVRLVLPRARPPAVLVLDLHEAVLDRLPLALLDRADVPIIALADATRSVDERIGRLERVAVLRRPLTIGAIADAVELAAAGHAPLVGGTPMHP
jgi:hypothetical protein